jgi:UDP-N-acetylmuramoylalanine--D-glutamate ligase
MSLIDATPPSSQPNFQPDFSLVSPTDVVVLGAARSGLAAAFFLKTRGFRVFLSDAGAIPEETCQQLRDREIPFEQQGHTEAFLTQARFMVASPGIPLTAKPYQWAAAAQIPVVSEVELAWQFLQQSATPPRIVAVTGSNGKSTVVSLLEVVLKQVGFAAAACGNIGLPMIHCVELHESQPFDFLVLEISSFQLETTYSLRPDFALLLNLYENHLDRHGEMSTYFALKSRLFRCQQPGDLSILSGDNAWCQRLGETLSEKEKGPRVRFFSLHKSVKDAQIYYQGKPLMDLSLVCLQGQHNLENIAAVLLFAEDLALSAPVLREVLSVFQGMPHRLEPVGHWQDRLFINDSKSTNYLAAEKALASMTRPVIWIAGGQDKGGDFSALAAWVKKKVKHTVLMGASQEIFSRALIQSGYNQVTRVNGMEAAIQAAIAQAEPGDAILLSPATASYDAYANFEARGDHFKHHVAQFISES